MKFPIDAVFVDEKLKVVSIYHDLKPWRITRLHFKASSVIELPAGTLSDLAKSSEALSIGDVLKVERINGGANG
jgi:uncharacterized membrane protein (UPF0127 family)